MKTDRAPALLLLFTALAFFPILGASFVWDDALLIVENPHLRSLPDALAGFGHDLWEGLGDGADQGQYYRPLLGLDMALDVALVGLSPAWFHLRSLLWHLLAVGALLGLLRRQGVAPVSAAAAAAVFSLHPAGSEAVAFAAARNDPMAVALLLGGLGLLLDGGRRALVGAALVVGAALTKESVLLVAPAAAMLGGPAWRRTGGACLLAAVVALGMRALAGVPLLGASGLDAGGAVLALSAFARDLLVPIGLMAPGTLIGVEPDPSPLWLGAAALGIALLARDRRRWGGLALALLCLAPALVAVARYGAASHRYLYAPLAGVALALGPALGARSAAGLLGGMGLLGLLVTSPGLLRWSDDGSFWTAMTVAHPSSYAFAGLGRVKADGGDLPGAVAAWDQAIVASRPIPAACYNVAAGHIRLGDAAGAARMGLLALEAGCSPSAELVAPTALGLALSGEWDRAEELASGVGADPTGKAVLVRLAAQARRGELDALRQLAAASPDGAQLIEMVARVLEGAGESAAGVRGL